MINEKSLLAVKNAVFKSSFCRPLYSTYSFAKIPKTIFSLFKETSEGLPEDCFVPGAYDQVIFLFIDGFGWHFFEKYKKSFEILERFEKEGIASKITSLFPSTTAAHVTCIHTDLTPNQTGVYEWFIYEPSLNDIIAPLPFSYAGEKKVETLPLDPKNLFPTETIYQKLAPLGITSHIFQPEAIAHSTYSKAILQGAHIHGYSNPEEGLNHLLQCIQPKTYCYFYYGDIDSAGHRKGIYTEEFSSAVERIFTCIKDFYPKIPPRTALILTADHGMTPVDPKKTYYLNKKVPNIEKHLVFGKRKKPLAPAGSCRDFFLHVQPEYLHELKEILEQFLAERALVFLTSELIEQGFFGSGPPSEKFLSRVGNLVILPYKEEGIWWYEKGRFEQNFYGAHGGLTREEMEIPFLFMNS